MLGRLLPVLALVGALAIVAVLYTRVSSSADTPVYPIELATPTTNSAEATEDLQSLAPQAPDQDLGSP
jgi:hypothetical protein